MREILFKAKRKDNGEWVEGFYWTNLFSNHFIKIAQDKTRRFTTEDFEIEPDTICQFTGLLDKNGNKIWENDIVSAWSMGSYSIGKVIRRVDGLYFILKTRRNDFWNLCPDKDGNTTVEVISNIFDNADLLEVE